MGKSDGLRTVSASDCRGRLHRRRSAAIWRPFWLAPSPGFQRSKLSEDGLRTVEPSPGKSRGKVESRRYGTMNTPHDWPARPRKGGSEGRQRRTDVRAPAASSRSRDSPVKHHPRQDSGSAIARQWAGLEQEAEMLRREIARLRSLVSRAAYDLEHAGAHSTAQRLLRALEGR